ncbi:MAG: 16S rRNA (cytosine(1402)-N(4))-methyltransferase RsmH [Pseudomonadota bacterium]
MNSSAHIPVMLDQAMGWLSVRPGGCYIDATFGQGGYTRAILARGGHVLALDRDHACLTAVRQIQAEQSAASPEFTFARSCFSSLAEAAKAYDFDRVQGVVMDLGVSSPQLDDGARGFSFRFDAPLDMRMDQRQSLDAGWLVNHASEADLADWFYYYAQESKARQIARAICRKRLVAPIRTTGELAGLIVDMIAKKRHSGTIHAKIHANRIHPATKVFQALRMVVNNEIEELQSGLEAAYQVLDRSGRLVIVSFHSTEDRIVKQFIRRHSALPALPSRHQPFDPASSKHDLRTMREPSRGAIRPDAAEISCNPRARSARMRVGERL